MSIHDIRYADHKCSFTIKSNVMTANHESSTPLDVYAIVTTRIVELLQQGTVPWRKPWAASGIPRNLLSNHPYNGINVWLLASLGFPQNYFISWDQLKRIGGSVKKGEKSQLVIFWKSKRKEEELENSELTPVDETKSKPVLRYYNVYNIAQCTGIPENLLPKVESHEHEPILECERVVENMPQCPKIKHVKNEAFYSISEDYINMPKRNSFKTAEGYYSTLFHELVHATGHEKRLNRKSITEMSEFGSEMYSLEELIAEMGSSYLTSFTGILEKEIENSVAYINGWLDKLKNDKRFIVYAGAYSQRAVDFILEKKNKLISSSHVE
jgi:antirestriction protein ArdC